MSRVNTHFNCGDIHNLSLREQRQRIVALKGVLSWIDEEISTLETEIKDARHHLRSLSVAYESSIPECARRKMNILFSRIFTDHHDNDTFGMMKSYSVLRKCEDGIGMYEIYAGLMTPDSLPWITVNGISFFMKYKWSKQFAKCDSDSYMIKEGQFVLTDDGNDDLPDPKSVLEISELDQSIPYCDFPTTKTLRKRKRERDKRRREAEREREVSL